MFDSARSSPKFKWRIDDSCLWGYFFTSHDRKKLVSAQAELERLGYSFVEIRDPEPEDADQGLFVLHVEMDERHTVESLFQRNAELDRFAVAHGLETYDGMDVGPGPSTGMK